MSNNLTGDYEAVVQVGARQINGLLAVLHQNGARRKGSIGGGGAGLLGALDQDTPDQEGARLALLHTASLRVGDPPPGSFLEIDTIELADWVAAYHRTHEAVPARDLSRHLTSTAPRGAARRMKEVFSRFGRLELVLPETVRGRADVQFSSPTVSLAPGSTSEITVHVRVRALYTPDPGTADLPQPLHGEVQATFEVRPIASATGRSLLIQPSAQDDKIRFLLAPGLAFLTSDVARIETQVRKVVRESIKLPPVDLPADFAFGEFKGVEGRAGQVIALPLQLSGAAAPPGGLAGLSTVFAGGSGFAVAVGREFVRGVFQPTIDRLRQFTRDVEVEVWGPNPTYHFSVTGADLEFKNGTIDLVVRGRATHWLLWDYDDIEIRQRFFLDMWNNALTIRPAGEPEVSGLPDSAIDTVKSAVIAERNQAIPPAQQGLNQQLSDARTKLDEALQSLDASLSVSFRPGSSDDAPSSATFGATTITPDGVIIRGDIRTSTTPIAPRVEITELPQLDRSKACSALDSWIPGGWIERFVWSWVEQSALVPWRSEVRTRAEEHRFLLSIPGPEPGPGGMRDAREVGQVCLRLEGHRILPDGSVEAVVAGDACRVPVLVGTMNVPSWWEPVTVPLWMPGLSNGVAARDAIAAHVAVETDAQSSLGFGRNTLVYFADWQSEAPLAVLADALGQVQRKNFSLAAIVVVPAGTFDRRWEEIEARLASAQDRIAAPLLLTEDDEAGWTRTFSASKTPAVYLIDARRKFVWQSDGEPDPKALAAALDAHLVRAPVPQPRALRLTVAPGQRAPDAYFADGGQEFAVHRLRRHRSLLNFWQSWSAPCLKELRRLQELHKAVHETPFIVAFHGGKDAKRLDEVRKELGLSFVLAHDSEQRIARKYGVRCWPTTISLDGDGIVESIQFGLSPTQDITYGAQPPATRQRHLEIWSRSGSEMRCGHSG